MSQKPAWRLVDLAGHRFSNLLVLRLARLGRRSVRVWACKCDCGNETEVSTYMLRCGRTRSCGCLRGWHKKTHGKSKTSTYNSWAGMWARCANPKNPKWPSYGGRGISVCERWRSFENFLADMGEKTNGASIDRIENDGPYSPSNCRWATTKEQARNNRKNRRVTLNGRTMTVAEWSEALGVVSGTIVTRLANGWSVEEALSRPVDKRKRNSRAKEGGVHA